MVTAQQLIDSLQQNTYAPVYFLQGEEPYDIAQVTAYIETHALSKGEQSLNLHTWYGKDTTLDEVLSCARAFPMLGTRQVVIIKEAQEMADLNKAAGQQQLAAYVHHPNPHTLLVFNYKHKTLDPNKPLSQALAQKAVLLTTRQVAESKLPQWIQSYVSRQGYQITPQAVVLLQNLIGNQLQVLASELKKIALNLKPGDTITEQMVGEHVGMQKDLTLFELQNVLARKEYAQVAHVVGYFMKYPKKYPLPALLKLLGTFFCKILALRHIGNKNSTALAETLGIHPYFLNNYVRAARCHTLPELLRNLEALHQADLQYKGIGFPPMQEGEILMELVAKLVTPQE